MQTKALSILFIFFLHSALFAQKYKAQKWGKISEEEAKMERYALDEEAPAVILQDIGTIDFYNEERIKIVYTQHRRIKIFDKSALKEGNIFIPYYSKNGYETFNNLNVQVFSPDGKKQKVSKKSFITEKLSDSWSAKKIFIPNVQKGSIIEYRFAIATESFYDLREWKLQDELPIRMSKFEIKIPPYYEYSAISRFPKPAVVDKKYQVVSAFSGLRDESKDGCRLIIIEDIPAIKEEPYCNTLKNYRGLIRFQLQGYKFPGRDYKKVTTTWEKLATELYESDYFGKQFYKKKRYDKLWAACEPSLSGATSPKEKAERVRKFVAENIKFNGEFRRFLKAKTLDDAFEANEGSTSEINIAVVALLREAGLRAWPLLISTQNHGNYIQEYPLLDQFNCVAAWVEDDGGFIVDATDIMNGTGLARKGMYNKIGWLVKPSNPVWIEMNAPPAKQVIIAEMELDAEGSATATFQSQFNNHYAIALRKQLQNKGESETLEALFMGVTKSGTIDSINIQDQATVTKPLKVNFSANFDELGEVTDDLLFFQPILAFDYEENPFSAITRNFPINFPHKMSYQYIGKITIPDGYTISERPEDVNISLSNNGGRFMMTTSIKGDHQLQAIMRFSLNQLDFYPNEYKGIREFFDLVETKLSEQIVLKRL